MQDKNAALKAAGAIVPDSFEGFEGIIKKTYDQLVQQGHIQPQPETEVKAVPLDLDAAKKAGKVLNLSCPFNVCHLLLLLLNLRQVIVSRPALQCSHLCTCTSYSHIALCAYSWISIMSTCQS